MLQQDKRSSPKNSLFFIMIFPPVLVDFNKIHIVEIEEFKQMPITTPDSCINLKGQLIR
jgi:hypothetical protein